MSQYKLVIFDLDGTILDTTEGILLAVEHTIKKCQLPDLPYDTLLSFIGPPIQTSFKKIYGLPDEKVQEMAVEFRECYSNSDNLFKAIPYEGIYELFTFLKEHGFKIAVATYKREDYALCLLNKFHFDDYTDIMFGGDNENKLKKKDIILKCLEKAGVDTPADALMIGDTEHDANGAKELGMDFVAVTYGFGYHPDTPFEIGSGIKKADKPLDIINCL